jgi:hypothetical protein
VLQRLSLEFTAYGLHIDKVRGAVNIAFDFGGHPNEPATMESQKY